MIRLRIHALPEEIDNFDKVLKENKNIEVLSESGNYVDRGTSKYERKYYDIRLLNNQE